MVQFLFVLVFFCFSAFASIPDLVPAPIPEPITEFPTEENVPKIEKKIHKLEEKSLNDKERYRLALLYIRLGDLSKAKEILQQVIVHNNQFVQAYIQMGFIYIWENKLEEAESYFDTALNIEPCHKRAILGLEKIALKWSETKETWRRAIILYQKLLKCFPSNPDYYIYLGRLYTWTHEWDKAEMELKKALHLNAHDRDALLQLALLYTLEKRWELAEEIYKRYPQDPEAEVGLARIYLHKNEKKKAKALYSDALKHDPYSFYARLGLARLLVQDDQFKEAKKQYQILLEEEPKNQILWREAFDIKSRTNISTPVNFTYTAAKENDPTLQIPVVRDYYLFTNVNVYIPIFDRWRLDTRYLYYQQKENNILTPTTNYNALINGLQLISHYYFANNWRWDVVLRGLLANGSGPEIYPFQHTARFEPGTNIFYNDFWQFGFIDAHVESMVIKNFATLHSQLLWTDYIQGAYGLHPDVFLHPHVEGWIGYVFYQDHNRRNFERFIGGMDLFQKWLTVNYTFEHGHFKNLTPNYFTYKQQVNQSLAFKLHTDMYSQGYFEFLYEHMWQMTHKLVMSVGNFIFIAPKLWVTGNSYSANAGYRYKDSCKIEVGGHYLRTTFVYRDWNIHASFIWQF